MPQNRTTDTTVYTVFAGYVPTVGFKQDDFSFGQKHGQAFNTKNGIRYSGSLLNYGLGLSKDGSIRNIGRIPGSIAWFEYSTSVREVQAQFDDEHALAELARDQAEEWYRGRSQFASGFNKEQESDALLKDVSRNLGFEPTAEGYGEEIEGSEGFVSKAPRPEERDPGMPAGRATGRPTFAGQPLGDWDQGGTLGDHGAGLARGIDLYIRDIQGNIIRLDVTERSMSDPDPHHGLPSFEDRQQAQVTAEQLLEMNTQEQHRVLLAFFRGQQDDHWNPMIGKLVNHVEQFGSQSSQNTIRALKRGEANLNNMTNDIQRALREMRGGDARAPGGNVAAARMLRSIPGRAAQNAQFPQRNMRNFAHMQSVLAMALHHLGNVVRNFRTGADERSMTSYPITPQGSYDASFVVGVMHRTFDSGPDVFKFMPLDPRDVVIANEAHMSHHYMRQYWLNDVQNQDAALRLSVRHQNLLDAAAMVSGNFNVIEEGTLYGIAQEDKENSVQVKHSASMMIAPEHINADIDRFINNLVANPQDQKNMHAFLKNKIRNVASLTSYRNPNAATRRGQIDPNFNPRGGPMLTKEINNSIREFQRGQGAEESGAYADWLAASGAMDLTPAMKGFRYQHSSTVSLPEAEGMFDYDMMGFRGKTGSSGMQQWGGRARTGGYTYNSAATYGPNTNVANLGRRKSTGFGIGQGGTTSQDYVVGHRGRRSVISGHRAVALETLRRAIGGESSSQRFLTASNAGVRLMAANARKGGESDWQALARNMGPDNKYYRAGEYSEKSRQAGWGTPNEPQLWAAPYVSIYYPAKQATVVDKSS